MAKASYPPIGVAKADLTLATELEYARTGTVDDRFGHAAAAAWVRQHAPGRPLLPSREAGHHILGFGPRAEGLVYLVPDLPALVNLKGLARIEPVPAWIGRIEVPNELAGTILTGLAGDLEGRSAEGLAALGRQVADRLTPVSEAVEALAAAAEALPEPYQDVARTAHEVLADRLENGGLILAAREAPDGWEPPAGPGEPWGGPTAELWQVNRLEHGSVLHEAGLCWPKGRFLETIPAAFRLEGDALADLLEALWSWHGYPAHGMRWIFSPCEATGDGAVMERVDQAVVDAVRALWERWEAEVAV